MIKEENQIITWVDDFCFDCKLMIKSTDKEHKDHYKLSDNNPEKYRKNTLRFYSMRDFPTVVNNIHESVYRSYQILNSLEYLLQTNTPRNVILTLLKEVRELPKKAEIIDDKGEIK